jgi:hypothetical protein
MKKIFDLFGKRRKAAGGAAHLRAPCHRGGAGG